MKNSIKALAFLSMLSLCSCTKVLYTHEQVLDRYKTKGDVSQKFGSPTEKLIGDSTEEWLYAYERHNTINDHSIVEHFNKTTATVTEFRRYERLVEFTFDKKGNVILWYCNGVDFTEKKPDTGATIGLVAGSLAALTLLAVIVAHSLTFNFGGLGSTGGGW